MDSEKIYGNEFYININKNAYRVNAAISRASPARGGGQPEMAGGGGDLRTDDAPLSHGFNLPAPPEGEPSFDDLAALSR